MAPAAPDPKSGAVGESRQKCDVKDALAMKHAQKPQCCQAKNLELGGQQSMQKQKERIRAITMQMDTKLWNRPETRL